MTEIYEMEGFLTSLTGQQVQTNIDQTIDFVQTGKPLTITQDGQAAAMQFFLQRRLRTAPLARCTRLEELLSCSVKECPTGRVKTVYGRHK